MIGIKAINSDILTIKNLKLIYDFTSELETIKNVRNVSNLLNTDFIQNKNGNIEVEKISDRPPVSEEEIIDIKNKLVSWEVFKGHLYSEDFTSTTLTVNLLTGINESDTEVVCREIINIKEKYNGKSLEIYLTGDPIIDTEMNKYMEKDLGLLLPLIIIVLLIVLFFAFKNIKGMILPLLSVGISVIWTIGLIPLINMNLTIITAIIPVIIIAIGSAYGIHLVNNYLEEIRNSNASFLTRKIKIEYVINTLKKISLPVFLSALTTAAGFSTLALVGLIPIRDFGILSFIGVFFSFIIAMTFIPSVLFVTSCDAKNKNVNLSKNKTLILDNLLNKTSDFILRKPVLIIMFTVIISVIAIAGMFKVRVDNNFSRFFKQNSQVMIADNFLNTKLSGSNLLELLIEGEKPGDLNHPDILKAIDDLGLYLTKKYPNVKKIISYADLVKKINEVFNIDNGNENSYYEIPTDPEKYHLKYKEELKSLITQYLMFFSGDVSEFINDNIEPTVARISIIMNSSDPQLLYKIENDLKEYADKYFLKEYNYEITGFSKLSNDINRMIVDIKIINIIQSIIIVMIILMITYLSFICGLLSIVPITISVLINFGVMGFLGIRLNIATAMISAITVGTGIDYTIHFISGYKYYIASNGNIIESTKAAMLTSGKAIIYNAFSVALGFMMLLFSSIYPLIHFGFLMCLSMLTSSILAIFLVPVMFNLIKPKFLLKKERFAFIKNKSINIFSSPFLFILLLLLIILPFPAMSQDIFDESVSGNDIGSSQYETIQNSLSAQSFELNGFIHGVYFAGESGEEKKSPETKSAYSEMALKIKVDKQKSGDGFAELRLRKGIESGEEIEDIYLRECYVNVYTSMFDFRIGQQIIAWGKADGINPTNNITPRDYLVRSPDDDDGRTGNFLGKVLYNYQPFRLEGILIPFYKPSNLPIDVAELPDFVRFYDVGDYPDTKIKNCGYALKLNLELASFDGSVSFFNGFDPLPGINADIISMEQSEIGIYFKPFKVHVYGADFSMSLYDILGLRGEVAYRKPYNDNYSDLIYVPNPDINYVAGIDKNIRELSLLFQYAGRYVLDYKKITDPQNPEQVLINDFETKNRVLFSQTEKITHSVTCLIGRKLLHETLNLELSGLYNITTKEFIIKPRAAYDIADALSVAMGVEKYGGPEDTLYGSMDSSMSALFLDLKISF